MIHPRPHPRHRRSVYRKPIRHGHNTRRSSIIGRNRIIQSSTRNRNQRYVPQRVIIGPFRSVRLSPVSIDRVVYALHFPVEWSRGKGVWGRHGDNGVD